MKAKRYMQIYNSSNKFFYYQRAMIWYGIRSNCEIKCGGFRVATPRNASRAFRFVLSHPFAVSYKEEFYVHSFWLMANSDEFRTKGRTAIVRWYSDGHIFYTVFVTPFVTRLNVMKILCDTTLRQVGI